MLVGGGMACCDTYSVGMTEGVSWGRGAGLVSGSFWAAVAVEGGGIGGGRRGSVVVTIAAAVSVVVVAYGTAEALGFEVLARGRVQAVHFHVARRGNFFDTTGFGRIPGWHLWEGVIVGLRTGMNCVELGEFGWSGMVGVVDGGRRGPLVARGVTSVSSIVGGGLIGELGAVVRLVSGRAAAATACTTSLAAGVAAAGAGDYTPDDTNQDDAANGNADDDGPSASID